MNYCVHNLYEGASLVWNIPAIYRYALIIRKKGISHVHGAFINWPGRVGYILSKILGCTYSLASHARDTYVEGGAIDIKIRHARFIVCCSQAVAGFILSKINVSDCQKIRRIYHGCVIPHIEKSKDLICPGSPLLMTVGRFVKKKGFDILLRAFCKVIQMRPACRLILVGDGPERQHLLNMISHHNLSPKVYLMGWIGREETMNKLAQADVLIVPSVIDKEGDQDGIPNVILEAFMLGVPVIASGLDGIMEAVIHEQTGLITEPGNPNDLCKAVFRILDDRPLRKGIIQRSRDLSLQKFNASTNIDMLCQCFTEVGV